MVQPQECSIVLKMQPLSPCLYSHSDTMQSQPATNHDQGKHCATEDGNVTDDENTSITSLPSSVEEQMRVCQLCGLSLALSEYHPSAVSSGGTSCKQCMRIKASRYASTDGKIRCPRETLRGVQDRMQQVYGVNMPRWVMNKGILLKVLENCMYRSARLSV